MANEPPAGTTLAHTHWGEPKTDVLMSLMTTGNSEGVEPSVSGIPYEPPYVAPPPDRAKKCRAKDDTCNGWRIGGSDFCSYHSGKLKQGP